MFWSSLILLDSQIFSQYERMPRRCESLYTEQQFFLHFLISQSTSGHLRHFPRILNLAIDCLSTFCVEEFLKTLWPSCCTYKMIPVFQIHLFLASTPTSASRHSLGPICFSNFLSSLYTNFSLYSCLRLALPHPYSKLI